MTMEDNAADETRNETKEEKFKRLAAFRVNEAIKRMQMVGQLGNRAVYDYSEEQVEKIIEAFEKQIEELRVRFKPKKPADRSQFSLD